jgi:hypothetical protein
VINKCTLDAPLIMAISDRLNIKGIFCIRINNAQRALDGDASTDGSLRASSVFGVFDGITRWVFRLMEEERRTDPDGCFKVQDFHDAARENLFGSKLLGGKPTVQEVIKRIGTAGLSRDEKICPWDPATKKHTVPTLILSGGSDPVTAGGQAEYFYLNGLEPGKRAFVEFAGVGHEMSPQVEKKATFLLF